ncbi:hypothetical protein V5799_031069 [Amblyomma americanum]|uniref:Uncharacterized protein n=1 Tax=Amblyomma americanum TaxID=6943 RepID=A0AAQ4ELC7_AMBAM
MESKDKSSRSGSRANLNESTLPLLEDVGGGDVKVEDAKEKIELEVKGTDSGSKGEDSNAATAEPGSDAGGKEAGESDAEGTSKKDKKGKDKKKDKKEKKEKKASHKRSPSCVETLTIGLNLLDRDEKHVNDHVNVPVQVPMLHLTASARGISSIGRHGHLCDHRSVARVQYARSPPRSHGPRLRT